MSESKKPTSFLPDLPATIHMVGIGGIGVSGLARILLERGYRITGSDLHDSPTLHELRALGINISVGHRAENVNGANLIVSTAAANSSNPELAAAAARGIPVIKRAALLGELAASRICLAVAGSHGKSTTSGMLTWVLHNAGADPSFAIGATLSQLGTNAAPGAGAHFVVEADEYDYSFLTLDPDVAIVTNIEFDHPDLFPDLDSVDNAFLQFSERIRPGGMLIVSADDQGCRRLLGSLEQHPAGIAVTTVGRSAASAWRLDDQVQPTVLYGPGGCCFRLDARTPGPHNRMNAAMVFAASHVLGVDPAAALEGIASFAGVGRRFEYVGEASGALVFDDYAHHPTEIRATINAAHERYPERRVVTVFQPHTFSRTRELLREFAEALDTSDHAMLVDIYPARETDTLGISSGSIGELMTRAALVYASPEAAAEALAGRLKGDEVVLFVGAGDIWRGSRTLLTR